MPELRKCFASATPVLRECFASATLVLRQCFASASPVLRQCSASASPVLRQCFASATLVLRQCFASTSPVLRQCYASATPGRITECTAGAFSCRSDAMSRAWSPGTVWQGRQGSIRLKEEGGRRGAPPPPPEPNQTVLGSIWQRHCHRCHRAAAAQLAVVVAHHNRKKTKALLGAEGYALEFQAADRCTSRPAYRSLLLTEINSLQTITTTM